MVHPFHVDSLLGRLIDTHSTVQSKLYLAYLHALTSYCLPDPLLRRTGTEQAISILHSAAVRSFGCLTRGNILLLTEIARLTPVRVYYPTHLKVMQTVVWRPDLGFLSQDGEFRKVVQSLFEQARETSFLYPDTYLDPKNLVDAQKDFLHAQNDLLKRDLIRSSTFRVSDFGAERYTTNHDADYRARDRGQNSDRAQRAYETAYKLAVVDESLQHSLDADLAMELYELLQTPETNVLGYSAAVGHVNLQYDSAWLQDPITMLAKFWCPIHSAFNKDRMWANRFQLMMWLATMSFSPKYNQHAIQVLIALTTLPSISQVFVPKIVSYNLTQGWDLVESQVRSKIDEQAKPLDQCPEAGLAPRSEESYWDTVGRQQDTHTKNKNKVVKAFLNHLKDQWPCKNPNSPLDIPSQSTYVNIEAAMEGVRPLFKSWFRNRRFRMYLDDIRNALGRVTVKGLSLPKFNDQPRQLPGPRPQGFVSVSNLFEGSAPLTIPGSPPDLQDLVLTKLDKVIESLESRACLECEKQYVAELKASRSSLRSRAERDSIMKRGGNDVTYLLHNHLGQCKKHVRDVYASLIEAIDGSEEIPSLRAGPLCTKKIAETYFWPRCSPLLLLKQLCRKQWEGLNEDWKRAIVKYGIATTALQQAQRLVRLIGSSSTTDLEKELGNIGHQHWDPYDLPEFLLLEVESGIIIRAVQQDIAREMISPPGNKHAVMQLNMGEGKSSVIVPAVFITLADGSRIVRVIVAKPQSKQMFQMLLTKLGGLLDRRIYHMPFTRAIRVGSTDIRVIKKMYEQCLVDGGVLLVQPEHLLSFQLMGLECLINGDEEIGHSILGMQQFFDDHSRDLVDESDENFSVKFELIHTMGKQQPIDHSPSRWILIQNVLAMVEKFCPEVSAEFPLSMDIDNRQRGRYPITRILNQDTQASQDARDMLLNRIVGHICETGFGGFPIAQQAVEARAAVHRYIVELELTQADITEVEEGNFWNDVTSQHLLLLRGLCAGGILAFALGQKRWRVNYGLDSTRKPPTRLAVPFRAKDNPTPRSEFSQPDVVIVLTCLSYYYGGLDFQDLFDVFEQLIKSDQAEVEYQNWVDTAPTLPQAFRHIIGVNLRDRIQCEKEIFPHLRFSKGAIDFFLSRLVFPKEMKEFPYKLSASSWDLGKVKMHPTTGFSGTNDSRHVLPLDVTQLDLPDQKHTNALVLEILLRSENHVAMMSPLKESTVSSYGELLIDMVTKMSPETRVILDVGAQVIEQSALQVAQAWLKKLEDNRQVQAVVFCDQNDELCVVDRSGRVDTFQMSPFAKKLDVCLVFLDEAHTRGIDLRLPDHYRAAVTLGANLTKDRLVQACMRMRKLGQGQSVVFCVPQEISTKITLQKNEVNDTSDLKVADVLMWAMSETILDLRRAVPLWAAQGVRFDQQKGKWNEQAELRNMQKELAESFLENEALSLDQRYRPLVRRTDGLSSTQLTVPYPNTTLEKIHERCKQFDTVDISAATLQEEQERELAPEVEQERQVEHPPPVEPEEHHLHPNVRRFAETGKFDSKGGGFKYAFSSLGATTAANYFDLGKFPGGGLWVTDDFATTVVILDKRTYRSDSFQRPVQWVVTSDEGTDTIEVMVIISPWEAHELLPIVESCKKVTLHLYSPQRNLGFQAIDHLKLYTVPQLEYKGPTIRRDLVIKLNLFAGQLYFSSFKEYAEVCKFLGLASRPAEGAMVVSGDGFIISGSSNMSPFTQSPVKFLRELMVKIRRHGQEIDKTHVGKMLDATLLTEEDFKTDEAA